MSTHRLMVFDVDGTLVDSEAHIVAAMQSSFATSGHPAPEAAAVRAIIGLSLPEAMARLAPDLPAPARAELARAYGRAFAERRVAQGAAASRLFPGIAAMLDGLTGRPGLRLGLATGKSRRGLDATLARHGLQGRFVTEQTADGHPSKPDPSMLRGALLEAGCPAHRAVMVGDTSFDIEMGRAAGMATIGVAWGYHPAEALRAAGADALAESAAALPTMALALLEGEGERGARYRDV